MSRIAILNPDSSEEIISNLKKLDIEPIAIPRTGLVESPLSGHPDIQVFVHENRVFCHPDIDASFVSKIERRAEVIMGATRLSKAYPGDIPYNILCAGLSAFHHTSGADPVIREYLNSKKITCIGVRQGYARCSTLIVDDQSMITADVSIHRAALSRGLEPLLIQPGHIDLPGYGYGFIGGATGVLDDMVLCTGSLTHHPDYQKIEECIEVHKKTIVPLSRARAVDLGTIVIA